VPGANRKKTSPYKRKKGLGIKTEGGQIQGSQESVRLGQKNSISCFGSRREHGIGGINRKERYWLVCTKNDPRGVEKAPAVGKNKSGVDQYASV